MKDKELYWDGNKNKLIRYYYYAQRGLALFNEFRYLLMAIFGVYFTLKLTNPLWLLLMFVLSVPVLLAAGWYAVHHVGKVIDWLNVRFSTHYSRLSIELLEDIREELRKQNTEEGADGKLPGGALHDRMGHSTQEKFSLLEDGEESGTGGRISDQRSGRDRHEKSA